MKNVTRKTNQFLSFYFLKNVTEIYKKLFLGSSSQYQPQAILIKRHGFHLQGNRYDGPPRHSDARPDLH